MPPELIKPSDETEAAVAGLKQEAEAALKKKPRPTPVSPSIAHQLGEENRGREHNIALLQRKVDNANAIIAGLEGQRTQANAIIAEATNEITMHRGLIMENAKRISQLALAKE